MKKSSTCIPLLLFCACIFSFFLLTSLQNPDRIVFFESPIPKIDGNFNEWRLRIDHYNFATKTRFGMSYDKDNVYFCFIFSDAVTKLKFMHSGMNIFMESKQPKKKKKGISIKSSIYANDSIPPFNTTLHQNRILEKIEQIVQKDEQNFWTNSQHLQFHQLEDTSAPEENESPLLHDVKSGIGHQDQDIILELAIPMKYFFDDYDFSYFPEKKKFKLYIEMPKVASFLPKENKPSSSKKRSSRQINKRETMGRILKTEESKKSLFLLQQKWNTY